MITIKEISDRFNQVLLDYEKSLDNSQIQFPESKGLFYASVVDGKPSLQVRGKKRPYNIESSELIQVKARYIENNFYFLLFTLEDPDFFSLFWSLCQDLIENARMDSEESVLSNTLIRWKRWKKMLSPGGKEPSEKILRGLLGELIFIDQYLLSEYSLTEILEAWKGPENSHKDFLFPENWYEIKTVHTGAKSVKISSLEQLDSGKPGELGVVYLDDEEVGKSSTTTSIYQVIESIVQKEGTIGSIEFYEKIKLDCENISSKSLNKVFYYNGLDRFSVLPDSPVLRRSQVPFSIEKASYQLNLNSLNEA